MGLTVKELANQNFAAAGGRRNEKMGVFVAGVPSSLAPVPLLPRSCSSSPSPFTPATQAKLLLADKNSIQEDLFVLVTVVLFFLLAYVALSFLIVEITGGL